MLISATALKALDSTFSTIGDSVLTRKLATLEDTIRTYTHNNFQNRAFRCVGEYKNNNIYYKTGNWRFKVGDTIQVSDELNSGLCVITAINADYMTVDKTLYDSENMTITKVEYPQSVIDGAIELLRWDIFERNEHEGVSSESISRHSVTYVTYDVNNTINGYPSKLFSFVYPYKRMRT